MKAKTWENLWHGEEKRRLWSEPDPEMETLISRLKQENIHKTLDFGCGIGRHLFLMMKAGFHAHGMDSSPSAIAHSLNRLKEENLQANVCIGDMHDIPYADDSFDFIVSWNVIYHTNRKRLEKILGEIKRILRMDGLLYLTLIGSKNEQCGKGTEVEPCTFDNPQKMDGNYLHHYSDEADVRNLLIEWEIETMKEREEILAGKRFPNTWHWHILARNSPIKGNRAL